MGVRQRKLCTSIQLWAFFEASNFSTRHSTPVKMALSCGISICLSFVLFISSVSLEWLELEAHKVNWHFDCSALPPLPRRLEARRTCHSSMQFSAQTLSNK